jgi:hypothetical protein
MIGPILALSVALSAAATDVPAAPAQTSPTAQTSPHDPYPDRPVCESLFLSSEWQLSQKQKACDWIQNRVFSTSALLGAVASAEVSPVWDRLMGRGDQTRRFPRRFATDFGQNAFKSTGAYLGGFVFGEDPRVAPPYLFMRPEPRPHGFWKRTAHALHSNVMSYRCEGLCTKPGDIKRRPALSHVTGSLASGFSIELLEPNVPNRRTRALRGSASAYAATFVNSLFVEFKPELSALAGRVFTILGVR